MEVHLGGGAKPTSMALGFRAWLAVLYDQNIK